MKCLTLFVLIIFCVDLISSTPFTEKDYDETLKDIRYLFEEGKEDAKFGSSTTNEELTSSVAAIETEENPTISSSTTNEELTSSVATENEEGSNDDVIPTTTSAPEDSLITKISTDVPSTTSTPEELESSTTSIDIPSTTTTAPEDLSIYTKENLLKRTQSRFNDFRKEFLANYKEISEKFKSDQSEQETSSSMFVNFFQNKYDKEVNEINENIKNLESKRLKIESSIQKSLINDAETLKELKEQQKLFKSFKNSDCKDCHGFLDINDVNTELESIDMKISELENKVDANKSEKEALDTNQLEELNTKYMELIQIYQYEAREWEKKESFGFINKIILEKHINDSESLERNIKEELNHRTDLAERLLNIDKIQSSKSSDKSVDKYFEKCSTESFEWVDFVNKSHTEKHGVQAGVDGDSSKVFVIRETSDFPPLYGKIALRLNSNDAYVTDRTSEFSVKDNIQILTANSYSWVSSETHKHAEGSPPICRAKKSGVMVPGTLLKTRCRIGFGFGVSFYDEDYEILTFNICKKTNLKDIKKWYK